MNTCPKCGSTIPAGSPLGACPSCLLATGARTPIPESGYQARSQDDAPLPGEVQKYFPHLRILRSIGQGGMGAVYEAEQLGLGRRVALKILWAPKEYDAEFGARFAREGRALAKLKHDNIVTVHDAGQSGPHYWIVMELVDGANLRDLLNRGRIAPAQALPMVSQICSALEYAHQQGIVHRDIKPENILVGLDGRIKVADFGLAKVLASDRLDPTLTASVDRLGTPIYMAPEQLDRPKEVDHRADIYSLGVILYELLTGERPIGAWKHPSRTAGVDPRLDGVVQRAMQREPARRYQAVSDVQRAVEAIVETRIARSNGKIRSARRNNSAWFGAAAILLAICIVLLLGVRYLDYAGRGDREEKSLAQQSCDRQHLALTRP